jgi:hypothetical protein
MVAADYLEVESLVAQSVAAHRVHFQGYQLRQLQILLYGDQCNRCSSVNGRQSRIPVTPSKQGLPPVNLQWRLNDGLSFVSIRISHMHVRTVCLPCVIVQQFVHLLLLCL